MVELTLDGLQRELGVMLIFSAANHQVVMEMARQVVELSRGRIMRVSEGPGGRSMSHRGSLRSAELVEDVVAGAAGGGDGAPVEQRRRKTWAAKGGLDGTGFLTHAPRALGVIGRAPPPPPPPDHPFHWTNHFFFFIGRPR